MNIDQLGVRLVLLSVIWEGKRYLTPAAKAFIDVAYQFTRRRYPGKKFRFEQHGFSAPPENLAPINPTSRAG